MSRSRIAATLLWAGGALASADSVAMTMPEFEAHARPAMSAAYASWVAAAVIANMKG